MIPCMRSELDFVEQAFGWRSRQFMAVLNRGCGGTCMLPDGHKGPHLFTPDRNLAAERRERERDRMELVEDCGPEPWGD